MKMESTYFVGTHFEIILKMHIEYFRTAKPIFKILLSRLLSFFRAQLLRFLKLVPFGVIQQHAFFLYVREEVSRPVHLRDIMHYHRRPRLYSPAVMDRA